MVAAAVGHKRAREESGSGPGRPALRNEATPVACAGQRPSVVWSNKLEVVRQRVELARAEEADLIERKRAVQHEVEHGVCEELPREMQDLTARRALDEEVHHDTLRELSDERRRTLGAEADLLVLAKRRREEAAAAASATAMCEENCILEEDEFRALAESVAAAEQRLGDAKAQLAAQQCELERMKSSTYGLSEEAAAHVRRREELQAESARLRQALIATEMDRRAKFSLYEELKGTIRVYCRVKGSHDAPGSGARYSFRSNNDGVDSTIAVTQSRNNATSTGMRETTQSFTFDRVFRQSQSQEDIFADVGPLVDTAVDGYRVCVFAYGQTGSGKTWTMEGNLASETQKGIIPRAIEKVFARAAALADEGWQYTVSCYFVEIYNDTVRDLLEKSEAYHRSFLDGRDLRRHEIKHDPTHEDTTITNVKMHTVRSPDEVYALLSTAVGNRSVARTQMNERSSRSHCVFTVRIEGVNERIGQRSTGIMCLVDLAGSERINESGVQGQQKVEAININKSLTYLGDCICSLGAGRVPAWRNCKLTHLLQHYLGVKGAKLLMLVTVSDREEHNSETINSLRFAEKVNHTSVGVARKRIASM